MGRQPLFLKWLALLGVIPALDVAMALVNRAVTRGVGATILPGLALRGGVPGELRTLVAVPAILTLAGRTPSTLLERLEIHYLASPDGELYFALLTDWADAKPSRSQAMRRCCRRPSRASSELNRRHPTAAGASPVLCCSIVAASGATCSAHGWAGSASAASCTN